MQYHGLLAGLVGFTIGVTKRPGDLEHSRGRNLPCHRFLQIGRGRWNALIFQKPGEQTYGPLAGPSSGRK